MKLLVEKLKEMLANEKVAPAPRWKDASFKAGRVGMLEEILDIMEEELETEEQ
jgi:hypothetical protein